MIEIYKNNIKKYYIKESELEKEQKRIDVFCIIILSIFWITPFASRLLNGLIFAVLLGVNLYLLSKISSHFHIYTNNIKYLQRNIDSSFSKLYLVEKDLINKEQYYQHK